MPDAEFDPSMILYPPAPGSPGAAGPPGAHAPSGDDDFRVLALDAIQPLSRALVSCCRELRGFAVFISRAAVTNIMRHGAKGLETEHEVAGGLVGWPGFDPQTGLQFTHIGAALAVHGHADQYEVEIPPEEWFRLSNQVRETATPAAPQILVGWYHSHPTFDAYLSALDQETQRQFFGEAWNVAIVIGPLRQQIKAFHSGLSTPCPLYLDPEETGGTLVPVTYEVSAGAVSTDTGIEWVAPAAPAAPAPPAAAGDPVVYVAAAPEAAEAAAWTPQPSPGASSVLPASSAAVTSTRLGFSPVVLAMLGVVVLIVLLLILLLVLAWPALFH
jgi:proteasome lid subunit RPN8/RPN11